MNIKNLFDVSMTELESLLKHYFFQKNSTNKKILTSDELSNYITELAQKHGNTIENRFSIENIPIYINEPLQRNLAERVLKNPHDTQAFTLLSEGYGFQSEQRYILRDHDITCGRMLRYMPAHWHTSDYFEIYYAVSGEIPIYFENDTITLSPGSVLIVSPNILHASPCYSDDAILIYFLIRASTFENVFWPQFSEISLMSTFFRQALSEKQGASYLYFDTYSDPEILYILQRIPEEIQSSTIYQSQMLNALMNIFFVLLLRKYEGTAKLPRTDNFYWKHEFSAIFTYIQTNYANTTIEDVSTHFNYSKRQISRIVKKCTELSFSELLLKLKMEKASNLLLLKNVSTTSISISVGYSNVSSFYRAFTKYFGKTPVQFLNDIHLCNE